VNGAAGAALFHTVRIALAAGAAVDRVDSGSRFGPAARHRLLEPPR